MSTDANRARAWRMLRLEGRSQRATAREFSVTAPTVARWADAHAAACEAGEAGALQAHQEVMGRPYDERVFRGNAAEVLAAGANTPEPPEILDLEDIDTADDSGIGDEMADAYTIVRRLLRDAQSRTETARRNGNDTLAQKIGRDAGALALLMARLEKMRKADGGAITLTPEDLERGMQEVRATFAAIQARPLLCSRCNRELSVEMAERKGGGA